MTRRAATGFLLAATVVAILAPNTRRSEPAFDEEPFSTWPHGVRGEFVWNSCERTI